MTSWQALLALPCSCSGTCAVRTAKGDEQPKLCELGYVTLGTGLSMAYTVYSQHILLTAETIMASSRPKPGKGTEEYVTQYTTFI